MANTGDAWAITQLLVNLPPSHQPFYWSSTQLHAILQRGGFPRLPHQVISNSIKSRHFSSMSFTRDFFAGTKYFRIGTGLDGIHDYKAQRDSQLELPRISHGYYLKPRVKVTIAAAVDHMCRHGYSRHNAPITLNGRNQDYASPPTHQPNNPSTQRSDPQDSVSEESTEVYTTPLRSGYKIVDIDEERIFLEARDKHSFRCGKRLEKGEMTRVGFDIHQEWNCSFCTTKLQQTSGRAGNPEKTLTGSIPREINRVMGNALYSSGIWVRQPIDCTC